MGLRQSPRPFALLLGLPRFIMFCIVFCSCSYTIFERETSKICREITFDINKWANAAASSRSWCSSCWSCRTMMHAPSFSACAQWLSNWLQAAYWLQSRASILQYLQQAKPSTCQLIDKLEVQLSLGIRLSILIWQVICFPQVVESVIEIWAYYLLQ